MLPDTVPLHFLHGGEFDGVTGDEEGWMGDRTCWGVGGDTFRHEDPLNYAGWMAAGIDDGKEDMRHEHEEEHMADSEEDNEAERESDSDIARSDYSDDDDEILESRKMLRLIKMKRIIEGEKGNQNVANEGIYHSAENIDVNDGIDEEDIVFKTYKNKPKVYAKNCDHKALRFELGMKFKDHLECKEAVKMWAVMNGHNIKWAKSSKIRLEAKCFDKCPWRLYASKMSAEPTFVIKSYHGMHTCIRAKRNRQADKEWVSNQLIGILQRNPNMEGKEIQKEIYVKFGVQITKHMSYRAKDLALEKIRGSFMDDYRKLRSYVLELMRIDREGKFVLKTNLNEQNQPVFQRIFIGFSALKKGFQIGCRRIIGFDACFLKTALGGALLAAVGKDCNYKMYPVAWAIVEKENEDSWTWFCENLFEEFGIIDGFGWSFMSDKQKGLINAIQKLAPNAEHRHCARHVYANWKKKYGGSKFRSLFWKCVKARTVSTFQHKLYELKTESPQAYEDFCTRNPKSFCKSLLSTYTKTDTIDNNICECFNSFVLHARDKPILHLLENIRRNLMTRMHDIANTLDKCEDEVCPNVRKKLEKINGLTNNCDIRPAIGEKYEVDMFGDSYIVDLGARECNCRDWELTGLPCCHAYACINYVRDDIVSYVDAFYLKSTCDETYRHGLEPIHGEKDWPIDELPPILPPKVTKQPGRPKKLRKRAADEIRKYTQNKITRHGVKMSCQKCGKIGHNRKSCKEFPIHEENPSQNSQSTRSTENVKNRPNISTNSKMNASNASTSTISRDGTLGEKNYGILVADSGNVFVRNPCSGSVHFVSGAKASAEAVRNINLRKTSRAAHIVAGAATQIGDIGGSQVIDNPTPPS